MRKIIFVLTSILFSSSVVFAATEIIGLTDFIDVEPGSWYEKSVAELQQKNIMKGYEDQTYKPKKEVSRAELAVIISKTLSFISHPVGIERWKRYINKKFLFAMDYPTNWEKVPIAPHAIGFRPPWMAKNSVQWAVIVRDETPTLLEELIAEMGKGYPDTRAETREQITLNGKIAWHVIVTTSEKPTWRHEQIFIQHFDKLYIITNGAIENSDFELFWRSLKFLAPKEVKKDDKKTISQPSSPAQLKN